MMKRTHFALMIAGAIGWLLWVAGLILLCAIGDACASSHPERPAVYELELTACTHKSATLTESIACENEVRARYGRALRALPDGGR
jgi:hypothetical protein